MSKIYYGDENNTAVELNIGVSQEYVDSQIEAVSADIHSIPAGGTAGQVLSKVDGTDYNVQWTEQSGGAEGAIMADGSTVTTAAIPFNYPIIGSTISNTLILKPSKNSMNQIGLTNDAINIAFGGVPAYPEYQLAITSNGISINGNSAFTGAVTVPTPTANEHAANKQYVDQAVAGAGGGSTLDQWEDENIILIKTPLSAQKYKVDVYSKKLINENDHLTGDFPTSYAPTNAPMNILLPVLGARLATGENGFCNAIFTPSGHYEISAFDNFSAYAMAFLGSFINF